MKTSIFASNFNDFNDNRLAKFEICALYRCGERSLSFCKYYAIFFFFLVRVVAVILYGDKLDFVILTRSLTLNILRAIATTIFL